MTSNKTPIRIESVSAIPKTYVANRGITVGNIPLQIQVANATITKKRKGLFWRVKFTESI